MNNLVLDSGAECDHDVTSTGHREGLLIYAQSSTPCRITGQENVWHLHGMRREFERGHLVTYLSTQNC